MNRFCPCFLKCYLGSAISKCSRKNWCFETPDFLVSKQRKSTENKSFSVLFIVAEAGLDLIKVWPGPLAGQQQSTGLLHLDWFESRSLRSKKKRPPDWVVFFLVAEAGLEPTTWCGIRQALRPSKRSCALPTAATRSGRSSRPRRRSPRSPPGTRRSPQILLHNQKRTPPDWVVFFFGCGGRTRTYDLRVMSPTSCQLLYSAIFRAQSLIA